MKTIRMFHDFNYRASRHVIIFYRGDAVHERVPEAAVKAILNAKAGEIIEQRSEEDDARSCA